MVLDTKNGDILRLENYCACSLGGMVHSVPADLRIRRILLPARATLVSFLVLPNSFLLHRDLPVTILTWAIPWESRRMTPICEGVAPFCTRELSQNQSHPNNRQDISTDLGEAEDGLLNRLGGGLEP